MIPQDLQAAFDNWGWWLASRASGIAALVFVTISVALGLMMASKLMRRPGVSRVMTAMHEQTALAGMLGAPFWFELLQRLVNLRGSGPRPDGKATK